MTQSGILYTAEMDLPDADIEPFLAWYAFRHAPDLYQAGFHVCTCYRAVEGDMNILDVYQAASPDVFTSPVYRSMMANDPYGRELMLRRRNKAHTIYAQLAGAPLTNCQAAKLDADWVSLIHFAAQEVVAAEIAEFMVADGDLIAPAAKSWRLAHRTADHPTNTTFRPRCLLLIEWGERPPPHVRPAKHLQDRCGGEVSQMDSFVGYRIYPWPNRKPAGLGG